MAHKAKPGRPLHRCPGRCGDQIPYEKVACRRCWRMLPKDLRDRITRNYRRDRLEHAHALRDALDWYKTNARGGAPV